MYARFFFCAGLAAAMAIQVPAMAENAAPTAVAAQDGWVSEAPPGTEVMGGFLTVVNRTKQAVSLQGVDSPVFEAVHMHAVRKQDGETTMEMLSEVVIPAGGSVQFVPGGTHLMLMNPKRVFKTGDMVPLTLDFGKAGRLALSLPVKRPSATNEGARQFSSNETALPVQPRTTLPAPPPWKVAGRLKDRLEKAGLAGLRGDERLIVNFSVSLDVFYEGKPVVVPADLGIDRPNRLASPLHTHADGRIFVESPEHKDFTLGQFFAIWGVPLDGAAVYVNGTVVSAPATLVLTEGQHLAVVYGTPPASIPRAPSNR